MRRVGERESVRREGKSLGKKGRVNSYRLFSQSSMLTESIRFTY